jgi:hypothetical protein
VSGTFDGASVNDPIVLADNGTMMWFYDGTIFYGITV